MTPKRIILHHSLTKDSETVSWGAIRHYHLSLGWDDIGYHFGIELARDDYEIFLGRMPNVAGAHTVGENSRSLGVCFVGNFDLAPPPPQQWAKGVQLVSWLCENFHIPPTNIHGHCEFAHKTCPGTHFDLTKFRRDVCNS